MAWSLLLVGAPARAVTAQGDVQVAQNDAWVDFPRAVDFHLVATAAATVESVHLEYGVDALVCSEVTNVASPDFEPDTELDVTWRWQIVPDQVIPPGGRIWWRWRLATADGSEVTVPTQTVTFDDDWFIWQSLQERNLTVHWYRGSPAVAQGMLEAGHAALDQLAADTGLRLEDPIAIYLYEEPSDLRLSVPGAPAWIGGIAFPEYNTVLALAAPEYEEYGRRTVRHELGHVVIRRFTFNCLADLPVWLDEGLAMVAEGEEDPEVMATLEEAIANDSLLTIRQIEGAFSVHTDRAALSYAESYSLVRFLIDRYGQEKMRELLVAFREGTTPDEAFMSVYGFDTRGLENAWRADLGVSPVPYEEKGGTATPVPTLALPTIPSAGATALAPPPSTLPAETPSPGPVVTATITAPDVDEDGWPAAAWAVLGGSIAFLVLLVGLFFVWRSRRG